MKPHVETMVYVQVKVHNFIIKDWNVRVILHNIQNASFYTILKMRHFAQHSKCIILHKTQNASFYTTRKMHHAIQHSNMSFYATLEMCHFTQHSKCVM
jgi:hypothetical protein